MLGHPIEGARLAIFTDASDVAMGASLNQLVNSFWEPLGFFSRKFTKSQKGERWSPYTRELLGIKEAIKYFRHQVEGREFTVFTDHKPITHAFDRPHHDALDKTIRDLNYISQFTRDIRHVYGADNVVADALSRIEAIAADDYSDLIEAQQSDPELQQLIADPGSHSLELQYLPVTTLQSVRPTRSTVLPPTAPHIWVDTKVRPARPFVPESLRRKIFADVHNISHPGAKATLRLIQSRYVWPGMKKQVKDWAKTCLRCQRAKVHRHTVPEPSHFLVPDERFSHIHIDVAHLPVDNNCGHLLTCIDRVTRWPEAWPIEDTSAETVARTLFSNWISRFGCPSIITTDQGKNFESALLGELIRLTGSRRQRTTTYRPQSNGVVERFHRTLKAALMAANKERWTEALPIVLLGLRSTIKEELSATPAELVYGTTLRLPGDFFGNTSDPDFNPLSYVHRLRGVIEQIVPTATSAHAKAKIFVPTALDTCSHVFVRVDRVRSPLEPPYDGPFPVLSRNGPHFTVRYTSKRGIVSDENINIARLKPAFMDASCPYLPPTPIAPTVLTDPTVPTTPTVPRTPTVPTVPVAPTTPIIPTAPTVRTVPNAPTTPPVSTIIQCNRQHGATATTRVPKTPTALPRKSSLTAPGHRRLRRLRVTFFFGHSDRT